jgi:hypothetical protein
MQSKPYLLLSVCFSLFLSSASAAMPATVSPSGDDDFVPPKPLSVVPPIRSPAGYENATVKLELVVDARGLPQRVNTLGLVPVEVQELVIGAVKKWKFSPATRHGIPVSVRVTLPLKLATPDNWQTQSR